MTPLPNDPERVLVLAPTGRDGPLTLQVLATGGIEAELCGTIGELCHRIDEGAGAALVAEEALRASALDDLAAVLSRQPAWSDFPFILLGEPDGHIRRERGRGEAPDPMTGFLRANNVTILERPFRLSTLLAATNAALRARRKQYEARRAISDRDQFLAMLGHELRNPLSAILFASRLMADPGAEPAVRQRQREVVERQGRHLARLVDDLLDVGRVTTGKVQLKLAVVDLRDVLRRSVEGIAALAVPARVDIRLHAPDHPCPVRADAARLEQVFSNLLTNGVKYTPAGGRVDVHLDCEDGMVVARVRDTGIGLQKDSIGRIFELFAQVQTSLDRSRGGLGIGLTLVKSLVELHGGSVAAASDGPGHGSEFTVRLPLSVAKLGPPKTAGEQAGHASGTRIVVVEDNDDIRETLRALLELSGHAVEEARDGREGVQKILATAPHVALIDVGLPLLDGYEVARRVRSHAGAQPLLVAVTGYGQPEDKDRARAAGFDHHITKPVDIESLRRLLGSLMAAPR